MHTEPRVPYGIPDISPVAPSLFLSDSSACFKATPCKLRLDSNPLSAPYCREALSSRLGIHLEEGDAAERLRRDPGMLGRVGRVRGTWVLHPKFQREINRGPHARLRRKDLPGSSSRGCPIQCLQNDCVNRVQSHVPMKCNLCAHGLSRMCGVKVP